MLFEGQLQEEKKWRASGGAAWWRWVWGWKGGERQGIHHDPCPKEVARLGALKGLVVTPLVSAEVEGCTECLGSGRGRLPGLEFQLCHS